MSNQETTPLVLNEEDEYWVEMFKALERLETNSDFKKVILDGYFQERAASEVSLLGNQQIKSKGLRGDVIESLVAISQLQQYFLTIRQLGDLSSDDLDDSLV